MVLIRAGKNDSNRCPRLIFLKSPTNYRTLSLGSNAQVAFWCLLGNEPLPRQSTEGRLQRQLLLYDCGLQIRDPMLFFEEITRRRLRQGRLLWEWIYTPPELDALMAAYVAHLVMRKPEHIWRIGDSEEGVICLPVVVKSNPFKPKQN